jgi:hypothetical protein
MFLSAEQLQLLTGRKRPRAQCDFLTREGYRFRVNACGEPVVLEDEVRQRFGIKQAPVKVADNGPDLDWQAMVRRGMVRRRGTPEKTQ